MRFGFFYILLKNSDLTEIIPREPRSCRNVYMATVWKLRVTSIYRTDIAVAYFCTKLHFYQGIPREIIYTILIVRTFG